MKTNYFFLIASLFCVMTVSAVPTKGLQFTGASASYINVGQNSAFTPSQFTVEAWLNYQSTAGGYVISNEGWDATNGAQGFSIRTSGAKIELVLGSNASWPALKSTSDIPLNTWIHLAVTCSGSEMKMYINGVLDASTSAITPMVTSTQSLSIGEGSMWKDRRFTGKMGDLRFWNVVRTPSEISGAMSSSLIGTETGLVANWKMNEGTGNQVADLKNSFNLTKPEEVLWFVPTSEEEIVVQEPVKGLVFDGSKTNSFVNLGNNILIVSPTEFTVEAVVNFASLTGGYILSSEGWTVENGNQGFSLRIDQNKINFTIGSNALWPSISAPVSPELNTWIHIAATCNSTAMILYVNGLEVAKLTNPAPLTQSMQSLIMGEGAMWKNRGLRGKVGYVRMWNVVKEKSEIRSYLNNYTTGSETNLLAAWNNDVKDLTTLTELKSQYPGTIGSDVDWFGFLTSNNTLYNGIDLLEQTITTNMLSVKNKSNSEAKLMLYSVTGIKVLEAAISAGNIVERDISNLNGVYFLAFLTADGQLQTNKIYLTR